MTALEQLAYETPRLIQLFYGAVQSMWVPFYSFSPYFMYLAACFCIAGAFDLVRKIVSIGGDSID